MGQVTLQGTFEVITCCHVGCGIVFAVPSWWAAERRDDHTWWRCPNGHEQHFSGESEVERLRREAVAKQARIDQLNAECDAQRGKRHQIERQLAATRGVVTRTKNRIAHGVCPCCKRTFKQLAAHMASQHPSYSTAESEA